MSEQELLVEVAEKQRQLAALENELAAPGHSSRPQWIFALSIALLVLAWVARTFIETHRSRPSQSVQCQER